MMCINIPSPSPFLFFLSFFSLSPPACTVTASPSSSSRQTTRKACVGVRSHLFGWPRWPLNTELPSALRPAPLPLAVQPRLTPHHVRRGGEQRARPSCRSQRRVPDHSLQQPSHFPRHIQGPVQEREEERWATENAMVAVNSKICLLWNVLEMIVLLLLQSQRRQMSTWWAGFKGTAWGTRPSWLASMMSQRPEETRCARTPWWNLRCSVGPRSVLC